MPKRQKTVPRSRIDVVWFADWLECLLAKTWPADKLLPVKDVTIQVPVHYNDQVLEINRYTAPPLTLTETTTLVVTL